MGISIFGFFLYVRFFDLLFNGFDFCVCVLLRCWRFWEVHHFQAGMMIFSMFTFNAICLLYMQFIQKDNCMDALQIKLLFQSGFDEAELKGYIPVIHANIYQTIKV